LRHVAGFNMGTMLSASGRDDAAEAAYCQALAFQPGFPPARPNPGHLLERRGDTEGALVEWQQVIKDTEAFTPVTFDYRVHALNNSARLLETLRRLPEAEALMRRSLSLKPSQFDVIQHYVYPQKSYPPGRPYVDGGQGSSRRAGASLPPLNSMRDHHGQCF
jgi:predicted O-linked N-acetylglucosamine transferase (SPINDLY family)